MYLALGLREISEEVQLKFLELFKKGHRPPSALREYLNDPRMDELGEPEVTVKDHSVVPDLGSLWNLYRKGSLLLYKRPGLNVTQSLGDGAGQFAGNYSINGGHDYQYDSFGESKDRSSTAKESMLVQEVKQLREDNEKLNVELGNIRVENTLKKSEIERLRGQLSKMSEQITAVLRSKETFAHRVSRCT